MAINAIFGDSGLLKYAQDGRNYQANIHDILRNCFEWTTEYASETDYDCVDRRGGYSHSDPSADNRDYDSPIANRLNHSFRLQLYIK